ncbi:MAG: GNAT family N-acetyltransferase [Oscillospiraceae bacterium]|jgi:GNAT superfamily N-acetyltransferase|nr:GNAT family N-acetyltransferase [Oscillospiraceae bacterium]
MKIEIRKLTPDFAEEYARFFDRTPHNDAGDRAKCYCISFCSDKVYHNGGEHWYSSPDERRLQGIQRVRDGNIQGYLAYCDGEIVGWCNANTKEDCQEGINYMRSYGVPLNECRAGEKTKFIFCFAIAPRIQRMGIATQLLKHICQDAAADGFDYVEAATHTTFTQDGLRGPLALYEKCGFSQHAVQESNVVMRKALKLC